MSAFAALWHLDGAPASPESVTSMLEAMPGGSGHTIWHDGPLVLGQAGGREVNGRAAGAHDQGLVIAGTYRLDNRGELLRELGALARNQTDPSDAELILGAYRRWGERAPERLLGDFAFVLWDEPCRRMLCARDHVGIAPFYYCIRPGTLLACATEARALLTLPDIPPRLDEDGVAAYLAPVLNDGSVTLVRDVRRLPAGSVLVVDTTGICLRQYWRPDPAAVLRLSSAQEYAEALRETLTEAVQCRLPVRESEGTAMSGGLDSSSVSVLVRELRGPRMRTPAVSVLFGEGDERRWIELLIAHGGFEWHPAMWRGDLLPDPAADIGYFNYHLIVNHDTFAEAARAGVQVLFGGDGGDDVLAAGHLERAPLRYALREGQWATAVRMLARSGRNRLRGLEGSSSLAREMLGALSPAFARRLDAQSRAHEHIERFHSASPRVQHARRLDLRRASGVRESNAALAARHGISLRSPFWDRRVLELCLAMPPALKEGRGVPRYVLRRAMQDVLPPALVSRGKWSVLPMYLEGLRRIRRQHPHTAGETGPLSELIDHVRVRSAWTALDQPNPPVECVTDCLHVASLELQVESHGLG